MPVLAFGALLKRTGFATGFDGAGDLWFPLREWRIFVECKRVQKRRTISRRVSEAHHQLERCYSSGPDPRLCRGFVALSVTKPVVPDPRRRPAYSSWSDMRAQLRVEAPAILDDHRDAWSAEDTRARGSAVELRRMAWIEAGPFICPANEVAWHPIQP